jgi:hypothetical protein
VAWIDDWAVISFGDLIVPQARAVAAYMAATPEIVTTVEARRNARGAEMLVLDIQTGSPQRPVVSIERVERVCALFVTGDTMPIVLMLREDFPDTEHQLLMPDGFPSGMCIDDRPWDEARLTWTPAELLRRIFLWFRRAARGELHDPHQPVDPFFGLSAIRVVVTESVLSKLDGVELGGFCTVADDPDLITVLPVDQMPNGATAARLLLTGYAVPPEKMTRIRKAPRDLGGLAKILSYRGIDIINDLRERVRQWAGSNAADRPRLQGMLAIIVSMPVIAPNGNLPGLIDLRMFITVKSVGEVGVALGVLEAGPGDATASGFVQAVPQREPDIESLAGIEVEMAQVHRAFDQDWAATLAGHGTRDPRKAVLVGAGAIGSHVAECLVREGRFEWSIVDDDRLLPHNLARHTLGSLQNGHPKAAALGKHINAIFAFAGEPPVKTVIDCNVLRPGDKADQLSETLAAAEIIIDASASVAAARHLSDREATARRASIFFNPSAEAVVALVEPENRSITLRDLEAQYYRAVLQRPELERHLSAIGERFAYTGACREVTNRVPESRIALLSSLAAVGLSKALDSPEGLIRIWTTDPDGDVVVSTPTTGIVTRYDLAGWKVTIDAEARAQMVQMREAAMPNETGGSVLGVVDHLARKIHVVEALAEPPDSKGSPTRFERGIAGLSEEVSEKFVRSMDQVRYVGEWHSHPRAFSIGPSAIDVAQLCQSAITTSLEGQPALSLIVGDSGINVLLSNRL